MMVFPRPPASLRLLADISFKTAAGKSLTINCVIDEGTQYGLVFDPQTTEAPSSAGVIHRSSEKEMYITPAWSSRKLLVLTTPEAHQPTNLIGENIKLMLGHCRILRHKLVLGCVAQIT